MVCQSTSDVHVLEDDDPGMYIICDTAILKVLLSTKAPSHEMHRAGTAKVEDSRFGSSQKCEVDTRKHSKPLGNTVAGDGH